MTTQICSCAGLDSKCPKCFGSGYTEEKPTQAEASKKGKALSSPERAADKMAETTAKFTEAIDLKAKKQLQLLNSIPFHTTSFRRDFKSAFEKLEALEQDKQHLWAKLTSMAEEAASKGQIPTLRFSQFLSDKAVDVHSNRALKELLRKYRKLKSF